MYCLPVLSLHAPTLPSYDWYAEYWLHPSKVVATITTFSHMRLLCSSLQVRICFQIRLHTLLSKTGYASLEVEAVDGACIGRHAPPSFPRPCRQSGNRGKQCLVSPPTPPHTHIPRPTPTHPVRRPRPRFPRVECQTNPCILRLRELQPAKHGSSAAKSKAPPSQTDHSKVRDLYQNLISTNVLRIIILWRCCRCF